MTRRLFLPLASPEASTPRPTVDAVRKRLGGRASTEPGAGQVVGLRDGRTGAVVFVRGELLDIWTEGDVVRRIRRSEALPADGVVPHEVLEVARDACAFGDLKEGQRVAFRQEGTLRDGVLVEKCRFGALVELASGVIVGVAFRRVVALGGRAPSEPQ
jgi:hypothetical protein